MYLIKKIVNKLIEIRGKGRNDYPVIPVWNAFLIMPLLECFTIEQLRRELSRNRDLRKLCGFNDYDYYFGKNKLVPPPKAFTNMQKNLQTIEPLLKESFNELREFMYENLKDFGKDVGEDEKIFCSRAKAPNKNGDENDGRCDMDADFTIKENYYKDPKTGETKVKKKTYFGYRYHLLADVNYELPIEYTITKATKGEKEQFEKHIEMLPEDKVRIINTASADKGYDSEKMIKFLKEHGIKPVIDIRNQWKEDQTKQYKDTNIVYTYDGKVSIVDEKGNMITLKYLGYDKIKDTLRYGNQNKIYSIDVNYDERIFTPIAREQEIVRNGKKEDSIRKNKWENG